MLHAYPPPYFWILRTDGAAVPNPGRMAIGVVLTTPDGGRHEVGQLLPGRGCNNEAELRALMAGLDLARQQGAASVRIYTDSQWLIEQLTQPAQAGAQIRPTLRLAQWLHNASLLLKDFEQVQWRWVPRRCNAEADALARAALSLPLPG